MASSSRAVMFAAYALVAPIASAGPVAQRPASVGRSRDADVAAIEKLHQHDIVATLSRDPVALTNLWTDDAIRLAPSQPPEVGKQAIRESNERWSARSGVKVLTYVPDIQDVTIFDGWAVEWGYFTGLYLDSPGGEAKPIRGARLSVIKKLPDGSWKYFRGIGAAVAPVVSALTAPVVQGPAVSAASASGNAVELLAIEKLHQQDIAATLSRDPVALSDLWTDDAVRLGAQGQPAEVGKEAIRATNQRGAALPLKVLTYVRETKDLTIWDGWAVEWDDFIASFVASPGAEPTQIRGTVLGVFKKLPDGSWKVFRGMGT